MGETTEMVASQPTSLVLPEDTELRQAIKAIEHFQAIIRRERFTTSTRSRNLIRRHDGQTDKPDRETGRTRTRTADGAVTRDR
jgi:hypothetical protein